MIYLAALNDFYETDISDEHYGTIRYKMTGLEPGRHTIALKVWNIFNYSNSSEIVFYVHSADTATTHFDVSPNPASDRACLRMEHNCKGTVSSAVLEVFDMQGRPVRSWTPSVSADSYVVGPVEWDLRSSGGSKVSPGVYIARFTITTQDGERLTGNGKIIVK